MRVCARSSASCSIHRRTGRIGVGRARRLPPLNHSEIVSFLWGVADLIRDSFKRGKYQDVILPLTVLRRLDCVLAPTKGKVLRRQAELRGRGLDDLDPQLRRASGFAFYNTSRYDFETLLADAPHLATNLRNYIAGFSRNMREVLERFDFDNTISKLDEAGLLFQVLERFRTVDLHPGKVDNPTMGTIFEELIRKFNEALDENPGEHFTPRDVVHLMVDLMLADDEPRIAGRGAVRTVYDPCCGSGGMLMIAKEHITEGLRRNGDWLRPAINAQADIHLFGQEVNPETWAVSKSDFFMKDPTGRDADNVAFGSTLSNDRHATQSFDAICDRSRPPLPARVNAEPIRLWQFTGQTLRRPPSIPPAPSPEAAQSAVLPFGVRILPCTITQGVHLLAPDGVALHQRGELAAEAFSHVVGHQPAVARDLEVVEHLADLFTIGRRCRDAGGGKGERRARDGRGALHESPRRPRSRFPAARAFSTFRVAGSAHDTILILGAFATMRCRVAARPPVRPWNRVFSLVPPNVRRTRPDWHERGAMDHRIAAERHGVSRRRYPQM